MANPSTTSIKSEARPQIGAWSPVLPPGSPGLGRFLAVSILLHLGAVLVIAGWAVTHSRAQLDIQSGRGGLRLEWVPFSSAAQGPENAPARMETKPPVPQIPQSRLSPALPDGIIPVSRTPRTVATPVHPQAVQMNFAESSPGGSDSAGASSEARPVHCPAPSYPMAARHAGKQGTVRLRLVIMENGRVARAQIVESSGRRDLDEAAQRTILREWKYLPAERDGLAVSAVEIVRVEFKLENS